MRVNIHDFRVVDRVLAESDPDSADVVFLGVHGRVASPFVVVRRLSGPGGVYIDALDIIDADGTSLGTWEKRFEIDGESKPRTIITELRGVAFPHPGTYTLQYSIYDDVAGNFTFDVVAQDSPSAGIVPGPLDAALSKSTILWLAFEDDPTPTPERSGRSVKSPSYYPGRQWSVWYGYENGKVYVLVGPNEQQVPGLTHASTVRLFARSKDKQSRVAEADCSVETLPKDAEWERIARELLVGRRLNLRDGEAAVERWKRECEIVALAPVPPPVPAEALETPIG